MEPGVVYSTPIAPAPKAPDSKPQSRQLSPLGIGIIGLVLLVGSAWVLTRFLKKSAPPAPVTQEISTSPTSAPSVFTPPIVAKKSNPGWKDYQDAKNNFSFSFPPEFKLNPTYQESSFNGAELTLSTPASSASGSSQLTLKIIYLENSAKNAKQFAQDQLALEKTTTLENIKFHAFDALQIPLKAEWGRGKIIFFEKDSTVYRISSVIAAPLNLIPNYESTIDQILATFSILDSLERGK
jgi:hypothetical protein